MRYYIPKGTNVDVLICGSWTSTKTDYSTVFETAYLEHEQPDFLIFKYPNRILISVARKFIVQLYGPYHNDR